MLMLMSAGETGQMSAIETRQMSDMATGRNNQHHIIKAAAAANSTQASEIAIQCRLLGSAAESYVLD